jgi:hypothetical protein
MRFPTLEIIVRYGIYTVKQLERFANGDVPITNIQTLNECGTCSFVYDGPVCGNCGVMINPNTDSRLA